MERKNEDASGVKRPDADEDKSGILKIRKEFVLKEIAGTYLIIPLGENALNDHQMMSLNETGAWLWKQLSKGISEKELAGCMSRKFEITIEEAQEDLKLYLGHLNGIGVLQ